VAVKEEGVDGYNIPRLNIIFGRAMRYGGHQGDKHLRLFRKGRGCFKGTIHEKVVVNGHIRDLKQQMIHYSTSTVTEYLDKLNHYSDLEAEYLLSRPCGIKKSDIAVKPAAKFLKQYLLQQGFRDGVEGFFFYALSSFNIFVKYAKYHELAEKGRVQ